ncbi:MAG TPA: hypothetical protein VF592_02415 [Sphingomonas sp.]|jgi:Ca2+-binding RTX toxin-like protein|uniref:calcium-binding protein n=1 Tax=Sphingomonas sp. TaxID=28214 RepID=UPI002ED994F9
MSGFDWNAVFGSLYGEVFGTEAGEQLTGTRLFNDIMGLGGNDVISGGGLLDRLEGGLGVDTVSYANACAAVCVDLNLTGWQWTGGSLFDKLSGFENIIGSRFNDTLIGDAGVNRINGGLGHDKMIGGLGNDIYSVDNAGDQVIERAGEGADLVLASTSYTLAANVENLSMFGPAVTGTGNTLNNIIAGNDLNNVISGKGGADSLYGGAGADTFIFEYANGSGFSKVHDFEAGLDRLALVGSVFGLGAGSLDANWIVFTDTGAVTPAGKHDLATTGDHGQFIFDRYHSLWWDADGSGAGAAILIGNTGKGVATLDDFVVI